MLSPALVVPGFVLGFVWVRADFILLLPFCRFPAEPAIEKRDDPIAAALAFAGSGKTDLARSARAGHFLSGRWMDGEKIHDSLAFMAGDAAFSGAP
jgi:hypothetical protein